VRVRLGHGTVGFSQQRAETTLVVTGQRLSLSMVPLQPVQTNAGEAPVVDLVDPVGFRVALTIALVQKKLSAADAGTDKPVDVTAERVRTIEMGLPW
jgi:hypothetical protein